MLLLIRHIFFVILISLTLFGRIFSFEMSVNPRNPVGGEGVKITIDGSPIFGYEINFNNKSYIPYDIDEGRKEIYLPIPIESSGAQKIEIKEKLLGIVISKSEIELDITARKIKIIHLKPASEAMRDKQPAIPGQKEKILAALNTRSVKKLWQSEFIMPLEARISEDFAVKREGKKYSYFHKGVDFSTPTGTPVMATNDGEIILSEENLNIYGNTLVLDHGQGIISCYWHLDKLLKKAGEAVKKGEIIAEVGNTGWSTAPHLHFGIYLQGEAVDPLWFIGFTANRTKVNCYR